MAGVLHSIDTWHSSGTPQAQRQLLQAAALLHAAAEILDQAESLVVVDAAQAA